MDLFKQKQGMKGPVRAAPGVPKVNVNRYSPVTNWNDDPFGADVFEPTPQYHALKKEPPPRPPPPKILSKPKETSRPSHFIRKPTVLTSLLSRKSKPSSTNQNTNVNPPSIVADFYSEDTTVRMFPKCEVKNIQTGALIDLSSPPSSPTFTTRSSSDGLSVDSFGSDATTSTNHHNALNGGNASQAESGFEDDFDLFSSHSSNSRKIYKEDTLEDFTAPDPFSPPPISIKPPIMRKPVLSKELYESVNNAIPVPSLKGPTIIRAKPARPKPPDNASILRSTFENALPITMNVNTTTPIQKISNGFGDNVDSKQLFEVDWGQDLSPDRDLSPPMPTIPPPPPPAVSEVDDLPPVSWPEDDVVPDLALDDDDDAEPYAIALFDYYTDHPDDLCFSMNTRVKLIRRVDGDWLYGKLRSGAEGLFPSNYVEVKVPLPNDRPPRTPALGSATALYHFSADQQGDLSFNIGDTISVIHKINEEWYFGECKGVKGQFPSNYVQMNF